MGILYLIYKYIFYWNSNIDGYKILMQIQWENKNNCVCSQ